MPDECSGPQSSRGCATRAGRQIAAANQVTRAEVLGRVRRWWGCASPATVPRHQTAPRESRGQGWRKARYGGASWSLPPCTDVLGALYAPQTGEENQILQINTSTSVDTTRGHTRPGKEITFCR